MLIKKILFKRRDIDLLLRIEKDRIEIERNRERKDRTLHKFSRKEKKRKINLHCLNSCRLPSPFWMQATTLYQEMKLWATFCQE